MAIGAKILSELSDDAVRWVESLANKLSGKPTDYVRFPTTPEQAAAEMGQKLVNLEKLAPQMKGIYDDRALFYALKEAQEKQADIGLIKPDTFRQAAAELPMYDPSIRDEVNKKISALSDLSQAGIRFSDVPYLGYDDPFPGIAQVTAHEGRHRSRALDAMNEPSQLVRFFGPSGSPRISQMDPSTELFSEVSSMSGDDAGKKVGSLGELVKFLGLGSAAAPGVLSQLPSEDSGGKVVE